MCDRPIYIDNPYKGLEEIGLNRFHDCHSLKLPVPCGNCSACIALRQNYYIQRTQMESISNHLFMMTLTYKQSMIRYKMVNGRKLYYADFSDVQKMFKRLRNRGLKFSYMVVSEYGGNNHRPHFHAIISVPKGSKDTYHDILNLELKLSDMFIGEWRRNYGSDKKPIYKNLCQLVVTSCGRTYDFHYINPSLSPKGHDDVAFYVTKYVTKSDKWVESLKSALKLNLSPDDFVELWKLLKPRVCISKGFGNYNNEQVFKHIRSGIDLAIQCGSEFPFFLNPFSNQTFPLAPVYQRRFLTFDDKLHFFEKSPFSDGYHETDTISPNNQDVADKRLSNVRKRINDKLNSYDFYDVEKLKNLSSEDIESVFDSSPLVADDWISSREDF